MDRIAVVIPAYNEERHIGSVVTDVRRCQPKAMVIVVDDCSTDATAEVAAAAGAHVMRHRINRGQGAALRTGSAYAVQMDAAVIVHFDADGQFRAEEIGDVAAPILAGRADIVFGSRFLGRDSNMPRTKRLIIMPLARLVNRLFFGIQLSDPQAGFRALSARTFELMRLQQDRMAHCSEIMAQAVRMQLRMAEVPVTVVYHEFGQTATGGLRILKDLFIGNFTR